MGQNFTAYLPQVGGQKEEWCEMLLRPSDTTDAHRRALLLFDMPAVHSRPLCTPVSVRTA